MQGQILRESSSKKSALKQLRQIKIIFYRFPLDNVFFKLHDFVRKFLFRVISKTFIKVSINHSSEIVSLQLAMKSLPSLNDY